MLMSTSRNQIICLFTLKLLYDLSLSNFNFFATIDSEAKAIVWEVWIAWTTRRLRISTLNASIRWLTIFVSIIFVLLSLRWLLLVCVSITRVSNSKNSNFVSNSLLFEFFEFDIVLLRFESFFLKDKTIRIVRCNCVYFSQTH